MIPPIAVLLITYRRTEQALRTIAGARRNVQYPGAFHWHIADDGSPQQHLDAIAEALEGQQVTWSNSKRQGVGRSMNLGMEECLKHSDYILWLEDDWECQQPFDLEPCQRLLHDDERLGMVRLGYISPGIQGHLIGAAGRLWWELRQGPTYTFTGHASLRHRRFCDAYGEYQVGLAPGATELDMCAKVNGKYGPAIVVPAFTGEWGAFAHIGAESLADVNPDG